MNLMRDAVLNESTDFMNLELSSIHTSDELRSVFIPTPRIVRSLNEFNWIPPDHLIGKVIADRVIRTRSEQNDSAKTDFETRKEYQYFGRQNNSMS